MSKITLIALLLAVPAAAHEFWLAPSAFRPAAGRFIDVRLRVGDGFPGEPYARNSEHIRAFDLYGPKGKVAVRGREGSDPAGRVRIPEAGDYVLGYRSNHTKIELPARKFEAYLVEEGLASIVAERRRRGESDRPGREIFSRCAKALLGSKDKTLGYTLELIAESTNREMSARVLYEGKPLQGALVRAFRPKGAPLTQRTDAEGRVRFTLPHEGVWMLGCVHMRRASNASGADWESLWASLTFRRS